MSNAMEENFRRRRDAMELQRDAMNRWAHPWSQWQRDWTESRRNARELEQLNRDEFFDSRRIGGPWGGYRPYW